MSGHPGTDRAASPASVGLMPMPFSFELFPPRNAEAAARMPDLIRVLGSTSPEFISVTFGAGGSSRDASLDVLTRIREVGARPIAHLTCVGATISETSALITDFIQHGIVDFLALRGDPPRGYTGGDDFLGELRTAAELVQLIRGVQTELEPQRYVPYGARADRWELRERVPETIAVACYPNGHPQAASLEQDYDTLLAKEAAGATVAITQLFFDADDYFRFVDGARAHGSTIPILPGLMPITSIARLERMAQLAEEPVPETWRRALVESRSAAARRELGIAHASAMAHDLLDGGAPGIHLFAHNRSDEALEVLCRVGLLDRSVVAA